MDAIAEQYLLLALNLDRHFEGFVDAYFGPAELKARVMAGPPRPVQALVEDAEQLLAALPGSGAGPQRQDFLERQAAAMLAVAQDLAGQPGDFVREVERYFDITPTRVDEATFEAAHAEMERALPGSGSLLERLTDWKKRQELPADRVLAVLDLALAGTRRRTLALFDLPPGEDLSLQLVQDKPWSGYNWYLGDYRSRIEINTDLPVRAGAVLPLIAHEGYPGHHTEHVIKEQRLYRQEDRAEHAVQLLLAPECVISEGIADNARDVLFDESSLAAFMHDHLYPAAGLPAADAEVQLRLERASEGLRGVSGNAALLLYGDGRPKDEVQRYLEHYGLRTPQEAAQTLRFIETPLSRSYIFNYAVGKELLAPLLEGPRALDNFWRLLSEPITPGQVRRWLAGSPPA